MGRKGSEIKIYFEEKLKFRIETEDKERAHSFFCDQPVKDGGTDQAPHPTEYLVSSLGACVGTMIAFYAKEKKLDIKGLSVEVEYEKKKAPVRVAKIDVKVNFPGDVDEKTRLILERVAKTCIVHNTFHHPPEIDVKFPWN